MQVPYSKPHLSLAQQLDLLRSRGMDIGDAAKAERYLSQLGYYRLSGYWYPFRQVVGGRVVDQFRPGTTFEQACALYVFDKRLRLLVLDALERIEVSLRVEAALLLSARDPFAHRNAKELHGNFTKKIDPRTGKTGHEVWLARLDELTRKSREEFVQRYQAKYSSPLPIWIAIELWDFGLLSHFIGGMKHADAEALAGRYGISDGQVLMSWVRTLNHTRNVCAHHSRLWNRVSTDLPRTLKPGVIPDLDHLFADRFTHNRVYAALALIQYLMRIVSPGSSWGRRVVELMATFPGGNGLELSAGGVPEDWEKLPLWA